ncbi:hypothetical protein ABXS75_19695 [Roseburia hominis]
MIKKIAVRVGVLTAVFIAAVIVFSYLTNRGNTDMSADMGGATLPRISFVTEGYEINSLPGYKSDMLLTTMRDTVTPVTDYKLTMKLDRYDAEVEKAGWEVYTLNGEECLQSGEVKEIGETAELRFRAEDVLNEERVLKVTLYLEEEEIYYYTRIVDASENNYKTCLEYAGNFHEEALSKTTSDSFVSALESNSEGDNTTFRHVTIHSDLSHVTWGELKPDVEGEVRWEVKECNPNYTSIQLRYYVRCPGYKQDPEALYSVKEFFRIRIVGEKKYLLDYDRTMEQSFDGGEGSLDQKGVLLGVVDTNLEYQNNSEGNIVSFVQDRELWSYDKEEDKLSLVFSFADAESADIRNLYDRHEIHIISVDKKGNTIFTVSGYMNRGVHEGMNGVAVYSFHAEKNSVEEKAFVPSQKGYYVMKEDLGKHVYFSSKNEKLYVMMDGTLYSVDMKEDTREVLVRGLDAGQYAVSDDGHLLAYQNMGGRPDECQKLTVLNLKNGKSFEVTSEGEEYLKPIGFIRDDFAYGTLRASDAGQTVTGEAVIPMYQVEIVNQKEEVVKTYQADQVYILGGYVDENMLTLERFSKNGNIYSKLPSDYITNNEEKKESNIALETYNDEVRGTVVRLRFADGISDADAKLLKPKQVLFDQPQTISFDESRTNGKYYVFALGELQGVYDHAGLAVRQADYMYGVAVSSRQAYVWERGNKPAKYEVDGMEAFQAEEGQSTMEACMKQILAKEGREADFAEDVKNGTAPEQILATYTGGEGLDLSGCTTEEILYTISRETPVIAVLGENRAVLLIGYNKTNVAYLDPSDGQRHSVTFAQMDSMVEDGGNTFIGYAK